MLLGSQAVSAVAPVIAAAAEWQAESALLFEKDGILPNFLCYPGPP